jgi:hypothetical protein
MSPFSLPIQRHLTAQPHLVSSQRLSPVAFGDGTFITHPNSDDHGVKPTPGLGHWIAVGLTALSLLLMPAAHHRHHLEHGFHHSAQSLPERLTHSFGAEQINQYLGRYGLNTSFFHPIFEVTGDKDLMTHLRGNPVEWTLFRNLAASICSSRSPVQGGGEDESPPNPFHGVTACHAITHREEDDLDPTGRRQNKRKT